MTTTSSLFRTLSLRATAVPAARLPCQWVRYASSKRWLDRQTNDHYSRLAKIQGLRSRAAFKLLEINETHKLFKPRMTVVDLVNPRSFSRLLPTFPGLIQTGLRARLMERGSSPPASSSVECAVP